MVASTTLAGRPGVMVRDLAAVTAAGGKAVEEAGAVEEGVAVHHTHMKEAVVLCLLVGVRGAVRDRLKP